MDIVTFITATGAVLVGVLEVLKRTGLDVRWIPLTALVLGVGSALAANGTHTLVPVVTGYQLILAGLTVGLASVGLHGTVKATTGN